MVAEDDKSVEGFHTLVVIWVSIVTGPPALALSARTRALP